MSPRQPVRCAGLVANDEYLSETGSSIRIRRADVRRVQLRRGSPVQHPGVMILFGIILLTVGLYEVGRVVSWLLHGGVLLDLEVLLLVSVLLGAFALYEAVLRVPILLVRTARGSRRLLFRRPVNDEELQEFARALETEFGYAVEIRL